ncbi:flagellar filament capping protein FliD [Paenibacillus kobensis]|uniref:flagellar filament capping protein FliD n=1 Tax=Paenibacillus kobensis TaxID=59841 RepID=UPI000FDB5A18|nr:flagellar filament capping protein FliD [Paenibacillus kobensis]
MVMRISGMSSGMDIDKIVSDLMKAERLPKTKLKQKRDLYSLEMNLYREVNTKMAAFRDAMNELRYSSKMTGMKATSSSTDVTAAVNQVTGASSHSIQVDQLADYARLEGSGGVGALSLQGTANVDGTTITQGVNDRLSIKLDNTTKIITIPANTYSADDLRTEIQKQVDSAFGSNRLNVQLDASNQISFEPAAATNGFKPQVTLYDIPNSAMSALGFTGNQSYRLNLTNSLSDLTSQNKLTNPLVPSSGTLTFGNGTTVDYDANSTLQSIMDSVNRSAAGVTMSYDSLNDKFTITSKQTGAAQTVDVSDSGGLLAGIGLPASASVSGKDATGKLDGADFSVSSNVYSKDGIAYTLNKVTASAVTVNIASDPDSIVNNVKKFVTAYNEMMELVNTRLSETKSNKYAPLTDEEKDAMNDDDIALWENKVKTGLLSNSSILRDAKNSLRSLLSKQVDGITDQFNSLADIGLTTQAFTGAYVAKDQGKIELNEEKLRSALAANPEAVNQLLTNDVGVDSQEGIFVGMYNRANSIIGDLVKKAGRVNGIDSDRTTAIGKSIYDLDTKMLEMENRLSKKEDNYYRQFTIMEQAIAKSNASISWLSGQTG